MDKMIFLFYLSYIFVYLFCRCGVKHTVYINFFNFVVFLANFSGANS